MTTTACMSDSIRGDPAFSAIQNHVRARTGLAYFVERDVEFAERVSARLRATGLRSCQEYLERLCGDAGVELDALIELLTVGETYFFRHREVFDALEHHILPDIAARNAAGKSIRIWSAGCSIGAEVYSLAMLLQHHPQALFRGWNISILGTDINRRFLARAAAGRYESWALRGLTESQRQSRFTRDGTAWDIAPCYRQGVRFEYHNLATGPYPDPTKDVQDFDLILCRNVMIYLDSACIAEMAAGFHRCLVDGGWLVLGHAEHHSAWPSRFETVHTNGAVVYRKPRVSVQPFCDIERFLANVPAPCPLGRRSEIDCPSAGVPDEIAHIGDLADRGQLEEALAYCRQLERRKRLDPKVHLYHALIADQLGDNASAIRAVEAAIYLDRNYVLAHYYRAFFAHKQGHVAKAVRGYHNVLELLTREEGRRSLEEVHDLTSDKLGEMVTHQLALLGDVK